MSLGRDEISFRLHLRGGGGPGSWWLTIPVRVGGALDLAMVPNSIAARSVITPDTFAKLRASGLVGASVHDLQSGWERGTLSRLTIVGHALNDLEVQIRDVPQLRMPNGQYAVDGYLGLDVFYANFSAIKFELRRFRLTLEF